MKQSVRVNLLQQVYKIYDEVSAGWDLACSRKCAACCTCNVTLTSLEGYGLVETLNLEQMPELKQRLTMRRSGRRFLPQVTANQLADICASGAEPPTETINPTWGVCPFLVDAECSIYDHRPFECRGFCSRVTCENIGYADMDPLVISINTVFRQFIEHMDKTGYSGNLTDMVLLLDSTGNNPLKQTDMSPVSPLIPNFPAQILLVPPEHTEKIRPIYEALQRIQPQLG